MRNKVTNTSLCIVSKVHVFFTVNHNLQSAVVLKLHSSNVLGFNLCLRLDLDSWVTEAKEYNLITLTTQLCWGRGKEAQTRCPGSFIGFLSLTKSYNFTSHQFSHNLYRSSGHLSCYTRCLLLWFYMFVINAYKFSNRAPLKENVIPKIVCERLVVFMSKKITVHITVYMLVGRVLKEASKITC